MSGAVRAWPSAGPFLQGGKLSAASQITGLLAVLLLWHLGAVAAGTHILPGPLQTFPVFADLIATGRFVGPLVGSLERTALGFCLAFVFGVAYGVAAGRSLGFRRTTSPLFQIVLFSNTLVVILWGLAIFGHTNEFGVILITSFVVAPTIAIFVRDVIRTVDGDAIEMAAAYKASRGSRLRDVYLPFLAPTMLAAARIGFSQSWKTVMLAEAFGFPGGIGWMIRQAYSGYNLRAVIAWLVVFIITLLIIERLLRVAERRAIRWQ